MTRDEAATLLTEPRRAADGAAHRHCAADVGAAAASVGRADHRGDSRERSTISKATVYNTLNLFCERGLAAHGRCRSRRASSTIRRRARITISTTSTRASSRTSRSSRSCLTGRYGAAAGHRAGRRRRRRARCAAPVSDRRRVGRSLACAACRPQAQYAPSDFAGVAQLVEHPLRKRGVGGSSPSAGTTQASAYRSVSIRCWQHTAHDRGRAVAAPEHSMCWAWLSISR